jgi:uncharacterized protein (UPF0212 family)
MKPYLMTVTSNIKKGVDCRLGQKTLLVGENGAGKSSVVQAIQLAAAEFVGDGEGRDVIKTYAAISRFFPSRAKKLTSSVVLSNEEQELYWELKRSGQSFSKGERKEPIKVVFPFSEIETALTGNADAVRAWLSKNVIEKVTLASVESCLDADEWKEVSRHIRRNSLTLDWNALSAACKKEATAQKREATSAENLLKQMLDGVPAPMTPEARSELELKREEAFSALVSAQAGTVSLQNKRAMYENIVSLVNVMEATKKKKEQFDAKSGAADASYYQELASLDKMLTDHKNLFGFSSCAVCGNSETEKAISHRHATVKFELGLVQNAAESDRLATRIAQLEKEINEKLEKYQATMVSDTTSLREEVAKFDTKINQDEASKHAWEGAELLKKGVADFCDGVNAYMPPGLTLGVDIESARIGIREGTELHTALSGGEWVSTLLALCAYIESRTARAEDVLPVLIPGDRAWHPSLLGRVMRGLSAYEGQVILMSTVAPDVVPPGWTVLEVVADEL